MLNFFFRINDLPSARLEPLVRFLPLVLDKLLLLMVRPPSLPSGTLCMLVVTPLKLV